MVVPATAPAFTKQSDFRYFLETLLVVNMFTDFEILVFQVSEIHVFEQGLTVWELLY